MRRPLRLLAAPALLLAAGCGAKSYDIRLEHTVDRMKYEKQLNDNLMPAPSKDQLEQYAIFVRPPKNLGPPMKEFQLSALEPGKFDVAESFFEKGKQSLHVLARFKPPKSAAKAKKKTAKAAPVVARGDFVEEVIAILNGFYGVELDKAKLKEVRKKDFSGTENVYKRIAFAANGKEVEAYFNIVKGSQYEVALIFEYPKAETAALSRKIELCLGSYATGERARKKFASGGMEEEGEPTTVAPTAF